MNIILASTSKYRKKQLKDFGLRFRAVSPQFDEEAFKRAHFAPKKRSLKTKTRRSFTPRELCKQIAIHKAKSLMIRYPNSVIIGADQLVEFKGQILGKPGTKKRAFLALRKMRGRKHELVTSIAVIHKGKIRHIQVRAQIWLRKLTDQEIKNYINLDLPLDCAGSYKFEKAGLSLVQKMVCPDPSSLIGLPLIQLGQMLARLS